MKIEPVQTVTHRSIVITNEQLIKLRRELGTLIVAAGPDKEGKYSTVRGMHYLISGECNKMGEVV